MGSFTSLASRARAALGALLAIGLFAASHGAQAQTSVCTAAAKEEVAATLAKYATASEAAQLEMQAALYAKFKACGTGDAAQFPPTDTFYVAARQCGAKVSAMGSLAYEEMPCCGYDPQRRTFACPVKIKQNVGFGAFPLPGSREYVLHCVADAAGVFRPVGFDSVHLANSAQAPSWQFAVVSAANNDVTMGLVQPMDGATRSARSILSWNLRPTDCNYVPIWGNAIDYRIRRNQ